ncbi:beta-1,6-glucanase [Gracilibacillus oryzae]|uniref:Beta-1,6-glucanase n=1 Tax=Gracilibacillus oryzae TaxID=1672701 RepID=A0A7C8GQT2_9BACI|nr:glycoside hydrolase family 30 beta sandwich domain-containing protein [Gracilibacillus oryzae]KAB8126224.1 beta-1,6-glucanase [Gracilibacillus oryzae]
MVKFLLPLGIIGMMIMFFLMIKPINEQTDVELWLTTADQKNLLTEQDPLIFNEEPAANQPVIQVDPNVEFQTIEGFGSAITGSSAYLINNKMSIQQREKLLNDLFSEDGINMNFVRHTIGASDFSVDQEGNPFSYTYNDIETEADYNLEHFTIEKDADIIQLLQDIVSLNQEMKIMGTPWTAPAWMKYEKEMNGWYLDYENSNVYETYANYFVKYIKAYQEKGITIDAITVQNEPEFTSSAYPSMSMSAQEQSKFINEYLGPAFAANNIPTKIIGYDHNWANGLDYATTLFQDKRTNSFTAGTAFHCYEGDPSSMSKVHDAFPHKGIYLTECSGGKWNTDFGSNLSWYMSNLIIGGPRNWARTVMLWNTALDESGGPTNGGCADCRGVVTIDKQSGSVNKNVEYYAIGHASKFVKPGAVRISSTNYKGDIESVAFQNPDDSIVLILSNPGQDSKSFQVSYSGEYFSYSIEPNSAVTFKWSS